ncbi:MULTISPECIES: hypothetical protein [Streptomyces]|uniref:hypothetical protein n=1 Tax=Streptomyces TaxID=1883 RepID=UPI0004AB3BA4|nr:MULTISPECIES: hypothetical protein [Streptomyces]
MPSLRQPVGPLPASIYWRRRVVVLAAVAAVVALIAWLMTDQGGDGGSQSKTAQAVPTQPQTPAEAITPGASPSGPAARPGGGSSGGSGSNPGGGPVAGGGGTEVNLSGGTGANPAPAGGGAAGGGGGGIGGGAAGGTGGAGSPGGSGGGAPAFNTPEVMALPVCASSQVALELAGTQNSYQPKDKPKLALTVKNSSGANCRVDFGRVASAITVSASNGDRVWSSGDCPADKGSIWVQLAANGNQTETFTWDRSRSKPQCATADQAPPANGTYVVLAELTGLSGDKVSARTSIRLDS